jgi:serine/threonine protein phosphatase 1
MKRLIVGDIHGCFREFQDLLDKAGLSGDDEIIALGDVVDRGPDTPAVLEFFQTQPQARSLMGNHERKHIKSFQGTVQPALSQQISRRQIGEAAYAAAVSFLQTFPPFLQLPEALLVHGFFEPGVPLAQQEEKVLVGVLGGEMYLHRNYDRPWYDLYQGETPIIVGHLDYLRTREPLIIRDQVFGLDTDCCRGGRLTGLLLPDFQIVSVRSRKDYWAEFQEDHADLRVSRSEVERISWERAEEIRASAAQQAAVPLAVENRLASLEDLLATAHAALSSLLDHILRTNEQILTALRAQGPFDELPPQDQGRLYAAQIRGTPLQNFLHPARKGQLTPERLRQAFKRPMEVVRFAQKLGLLEQEADQE